MYRVFDRHHDARYTGELFRNGERLRQEPLHLAGTVHGQLVLIRKLVHSEDGYDVLKFLVSLEYLLDSLGSIVMVFADNVRIEDS